MPLTGHSKAEIADQPDMLEEENLLFRKIIDSIHEAVYVVHKDGKITLYNRESERMENLDRKEVLGKTEKEAFFQPYYFADEVTKKVFNTGKPILEQPYWYYLTNGRKTNMIYSAFPFFYRGEVTSVYVIFRNMNQMSDFIANTMELQKKFTKETNYYRKDALYLLDDIVGKSVQMKKIVREARQIAPRQSPVLIFGKTGTGKELFAQGIHNASLFAKGPFIGINCAAIPETLLESMLFGTVKGAFTGATDVPGLFEQAEDGTIFLDEINSMPLSLQAKLLRVLQEKKVRRLGGSVPIPVNCRVISATNVDPTQAVQEQTIRSDLYFRLATITINIPPLVERQEDIKVLTMHFIEKFNLEFDLFVHDLSNELLYAFEKYAWPGNVRELENFVESAMNFIQREDTILELDHLPEYFRERLESNKDCAHPATHTGTLQSILAETEKNLIKQYLAQNRNNITKTAQDLGISRQNLYYKIKTLGLDNK
ncbi:sigma-54 interaction domain-containing protein [Dehalobacterium formicoaceticum]|uniref:Sigma 54-interacting transcriptional regulator n=1 Tax=Dehalobacterium formicoaceticum TaxID=51515 RepID=A0ABT1Y103_9FIRM|nr:sigma 54-interacting transcriptional regulator [Dehalobacterium formicoaceticum]MCR6544533.1 sigma 54-interacting transcriptional regulator [Dehalobacterium formicoaceticum]